MAKPIYLGQHASLALDKLLTTRLLVQAMSGAGKTYALRRLLEQSHGAVQHLVIDPEGEFPSLRSRFDYVLAAKREGDTLADPRTAKLLAERLLELGVSAVLDIYELQHHQRIAFVKTFLETLVDAPKRLWHPVLVVLDEAHVYAPEKTGAESLSAVIDLATRGRKRGYCLIAATQRLSKFHKDVAAELGNKMIGRTTLDVDLKRAADELGLMKEDWAALRDLKDGEFYAFGPAFNHVSVKTITVGDVQTHHPKSGAHAAAVVPPPSDKVKAVLAKIADLPAEVEQKAKTEADLKKQIAELQRENRQWKTATVGGAIHGAPKPAISDTTRGLFKAVVQATDNVAGVIETLEAEAQAALRKAMAPVVVKLRAPLENLRKAQRGISVLLDGQKTLAAATAINVEMHKLAKMGELPPGRIKELPASKRRVFGGFIRAPLPAPGEEMLTGPEQRILNALAQLDQLGNTEPTETAVAFLARYTVSGGGFNNPKGRLRSRGCIEYLPGGRLRLTEQGKARAHWPDVPVTNEDLHANIFSLLDGPQTKILKPLLDIYPGELSLDELAERTGYSVDGGGFNNPKGRLRSLGLIEYRPQRKVVASAACFVEEPVEGPHV